MAPEEKHVEIDDAPVSASLFTGLFFHNARDGPAWHGAVPLPAQPRAAREALERRLRLRRTLGIPRGSIRATVLIETIPAAFGMDEILHELEHRWAQQVGGTTSSA